MLGGTPQTVGHHGNFPQTVGHHGNGQHCFCLTNDKQDHDCDTLNYAIPGRKCCSPHYHGPCQSNNVSIGLTKARMTLSSIIYQSGLVLIATESNGRSQCCTSLTRMHTNKVTLIISAWICSCCVSL